MQVRQPAILLRNRWMWSAAALGCVRSWLLQGRVPRVLRAQPRAPPPHRAKRASGTPAAALLAFLKGFHRLERAGKPVEHTGRILSDVEYPAALLDPLQTGHDFVFPNDIVRIDGSEADLPLARGARLADPDDFVGGAPAQSLQRDDLPDFSDARGRHQARACSRDVVGATGLRVRRSPTGKDLNRDRDVEPSLMPGIVGGRRGSPFGGEILLR